MGNTVCKLGDCDCSGHHFVFDIPAANCKRDDRRGDQRLIQSSDSEKSALQLMSGLKTLSKMNQLKRCPAFSKRGIFLFVQIAVGGKKMVSRTKRGTQNKKGESFNLFPS